MLMEQMPVQQVEVLLFLLILKGWVVVWQQHTFIIKFLMPAWSKMEPDTIFSQLRKRLTVSFLSVLAS